MEPADSETHPNLGTLHHQGIRLGQHKMEIQALHQVVHHPCGHMPSMTTLARDSAAASQTAGLATTQVAPEDFQNCVFSGTETPRVRATVFFVPN